MELMFSGSESLLSLPDISKWNTNRVTIMYEMYSWCSSLSSLLDISRWNTNNVTDIGFMFRDVHHYHLCLIFQNGILKKSLI